MLPVGLAVKLEEVRTAEAADKAAYEAALKAGWTSTELRKVGLASPGKLKTTGSRKPAKKTSSSSSSTPVSTEAAGEDRE